MIASMCCGNVLAEMVAKRRLQVDRQAAIVPGLTIALDQLLRRHVLTEWQPSPTEMPDRRSLAFEHNFLSTSLWQRFICRLRTPIWPKCSCATRLGYCPSTKSRLALAVAMVGEAGQVLAARRGLFRGSRAIAARLYDPDDYRCRECVGYRKPQAVDRCDRLALPGGIGSVP